MSAFIEEEHPRTGSGRFADREHRAPGLVLVEGSGAVQIIDQVLANLSSEPAEEERIRRMLSEKSADEVLKALDEDNHGGRCAADAGNPSFNPSWCSRCLVARSLEYQLRPTPDPTVYGAVPGPPKHYDVEPGNPDATGDEAFHAAVRSMLKAPASAEVSVELTADPMAWTVDNREEIIVRAGNSVAIYQDLGALMRALDSASRPETSALARQFCDDNSVPGPHYYGNAAVYVYSEDGGAPEPVFGWPALVHVFGDSESLQVLHRDGSEVLIPMEEIAGILETSETRVVQE